jgi:hypothetical protein
MIRDIELSKSIEAKNRVIQWIEKSKKVNNKFEVIDVGGSVSGWSSEYTQAIVDFNPPEKNDDKILHFSFDINYPDGWEEVEEYVRKNGKFDFSICTHTLEDISNPKYVCQKLSSISKSGFISIPSKYKELYPGNSITNDKKILGFIHHRWIFSILDGDFIGYPKVTFIEIDPIFRSIGKSDPKLSNLSFFWDDQINLEIINHDYLGPNISSVINMYRKNLLNDDLDKNYKILNL